MHRVESFRRRRRMSLRWISSTMAALVIAFIRWRRTGAIRACASPRRHRTPRPSYTHRRQCCRRRGRPGRTRCSPHSVVGAGLLRGPIFRTRAGKQVTCVTVPPLPQTVPRSTPASEHPLQIGGGTQGSISDYAVAVTGNQNIASATASFANVTGAQDDLVQCGIQTASSASRSIATRSPTLPRTPYQPAAAPARPPIASDGSSSSTPTAMTVIMGGSTSSTG